MLETYAGLPLLNPSYLHPCPVACATNFYKDGAICKACTGGGKSSGGVNAACTCADSGSAYKTAQAYDTDYGCGERPVFCKGFAGAPASKLMLGEPRASHFCTASDKCHIVVLAACASNHYKAADGTCKACKSGSISVGGTESTCQCTAANFDGAAYNFDTGCGALPSPPCCTGSCS
jgi:hypothetical protein